MSEHTPFDARLERGIQALADKAQTHVDAVAMAEHAAGPRRSGPWAILGREVPVPVSLLIVLILLLAALTLTATGGAFLNRDSDAQPALPEIVQPAGLPAVVMLPTTDGTGDEVVTTHELPTLTTPAIETRAGDRVTLRGGTFSIDINANDPRIGGTATWRFEADLPASAGVATGFGAGPVHGTYRLVGPDGTWDGDCSGTVLVEPLSITGSCWLAGSGAYAGSTYFRSFAWRFAAPWDPDSGSSEGIVYPASPPAP